MRVLFIADAYEQYGSVTSFKELVITLKNQYQVVPVILVSKDAQLKRFADENHIECYVTHHQPFCIDKGSTIFRKIRKYVLFPLYYLKYIRFTKKAMRIVEKNIDMSQIDLIHTNINRYDMGAILAEKYHIPHVWHIREFGEKDYDCLFLKKNYISFMNRSNSYFVAISKAVQTYWIEKGLNPNKIVMIYNGVDSIKFHNSEKKHCDNQVKLVFSGSISPRKGQIQAIEAISLLDKKDQKRVTLDIYGDGVKEYVWFLKYKVKKKKLDDRIHFKGYSSQLYELLPNYDIGLVCSKSEAFGRVTIEYMMSHLCVIASDTGANSELIQDGKSGILYRYGDIKDFQEKIKMMIHQPSLMEKIANHGMKYANNHFSKDNNAKKIYELYCSLTSK